jgi:hypothetical protein
MIISKKPTLGTSALFIATILMITPLVSLIAVANAQEQEQDISITEPTKQLTARWWQWVFSIPPADNPLLDTTTGENCQAGDMGDIFFLVGTLGGSAERDCTISEGQEILIPIINTICLDKPGVFDEPRDFQPPIGGPGSCQETVESSIDQASGLELTIDGVSIEILEDFRVQSNPFPLKAQEDNLLGALFGVPPGTYISISDGYWVVVESLPAGEHTIHFAGQSPDVGAVDVTYHLTVV